MMNIVILIARKEALFCPKRLVLKVSLFVCSTNNEELEFKTIMHSLTHDACYAGSWHAGQQ